MQESTCTLFKPECHHITDAVRTIAFQEQATTMHSIIVQWLLRRHAHDQALGVTHLLLAPAILAANKGSFSAHQQLLIPDTDQKLCQNCKHACVSR